jgi:glycerophosphoryl diester phosphodiesterase
MRRSLLLVLLIPLAARAQERPLHRLAPESPQALRALFRPSGRPLPFVSAHRGGARPGFPENCLATFEDTLRHTPAILEIDPRKTRDGHLVLMHDATLDRTTTGTGRVAERTLDELKGLRLKDPEGNVTPCSIPTLDEALEWARGKTILVLDAKDVPIAERVRAIERNHAESYAMVIAYGPDDIKACYRLNPNLMMEVMITTRAQLDAFDRLGVPWANVVAFVGHTATPDAALCAAIHRRGAATMAGTSRNLDRQLIEGKAPDLKPIEGRYRAILESGVDLIETDIPTHLGPLLRGNAPPAP